MLKGKNKGFTLVELLIVIAIIGILAGAILLAINPARMLRESRNTQRVSDLDTVARALNIALAEQVLTLDACAAGGCDSATSDLSIGGTTGWVRFTVVGGGPGLGRYMAALPQDPTNTGDFVYRYQADAAEATFELSAVLEGDENLPRMVNDGGNDDTRYQVGTAPGLGLINPTP